MREASKVRTRSNSRALTLRSRVMTPSVTGTGQPLRALDKGSCDECLARRTAAVQQRSSSLLLLQQKPADGAPHAGGLGLLGRLFGLSASCCWLCCGQGGLVDCRKLITRENRIEFIRAQLVDCSSFWSTPISYLACAAPRSVSRSHPHSFSHDTHTIPRLLQIAAFESHLTPAHGTALHCASSLLVSTRFKAHTHTQLTPISSLRRVLPPILV